MPSVESIGQPIQHINHPPVHMVHDQALSQHQQTFSDAYDGAVHIHKTPAHLHKTIADAKRRLTIARATPPKIDPFTKRAVMSDKQIKQVLERESRPTFKGYHDINNPAMTHRQQSMLKLATSVALGGAAYLGRTQISNLIKSTLSNTYSTKIGQKGMDAIVKRALQVRDGVNPYYGKDYYRVQERVLGTAMSPPRKQFRGKYSTKPQPKPKPTNKGRYSTSRIPRGNYSKPTSTKGSQTNKTKGQNGLSFIPRQKKKKKKYNNPVKEIGAITYYT